MNLVDLLAATGLMMAIAVPVAILSRRLYSVLESAVYGVDADEATGGDET